MKIKSIENGKVKGYVDASNVSRELGADFTTSKIKKNKADEGIREEIALAIENGIPVFVVGSVGGCSSIVASEYKANGWQGLNDAPLVMNNEFAESLDYVMLSKQLLDYLNEKQ